MADQITPAKVRFAEAIANLQGKLPEASLRWDDLAGPVHGKVFTVAGATSADLARDIQTALVKAIDEGSTISTFRRDFDQIVQAHGWTYRGKRGWRTAVIFDTNMRSAHMAGRWAQLQANKANRPFLQYRTAGDARVRKQHRAWNGKVYPIDDVFWLTHYPPNGWGCRCTVRAYGADELDRKGLRVSEPTKLQSRNVVNRDGEIIDRVPLGIDPGWDHNVGMSWITPELSLGAKLARLPPDLRGLVTDKTISPAFQTAISDNWKAFQEGVKASRKPVGDAQILGFLDSATMSGMAEQVGEVQLQSSAVVAFDNRTNHLTGSHKQTANPLQVWPQDMVDALPMLLRDYQAVLWDRVSEVLVVIPSGAWPGDIPGRLGKIVLRPNIKTKYGTAVSVVSLGSAQATNFAEATRYQLLVGRLK